MPDNSCRLMPALRQCRAMGRRIAENAHVRILGMCYCVELSPAIAFLEDMRRRPKLPNGVPGLLALARQDLG